MNDLAFFVFFAVQLLSLGLRALREPDQFRSGVLVVAVILGKRWQARGPVCKFNEHWMLCLGERNEILTPMLAQKGPETDDKASRRGVLRRLLQTAHHRGIVLQCGVGVSA